MRNGRRVSVRDTFRGSLAAGLEQHDAETAEDPVERRLVECEVLGGHGVKSDVAEPFRLHFVLRGTHHARGGVAADDVDVRLSPRQREGRLAGARRAVEYLDARPCRERLEQGLTHRRELRQKEVKLFGDGVPVGLIVVSVHFASHVYSYSAQHDGRCAVYLLWRHRIRRTRGRETDQKKHTKNNTG